MSNPNYSEMFKRDKDKVVESFIEENPQYFKEPTNSTTSVKYIIVYEDQDKQDEYFTCGKTAINRLEIVRYSWNCHLFERILSV